jgi:hypothetical protein
MPLPTVRPVRQTAFVARPEPASGNSWAGETPTCSALLLPLELHMLVCT